MSATHSSLAPGPRGHWLLGHIPEFRSDLLGLLTRSAQAFGDVVRFRLGPKVIHLLNHPAHVEHVLQANAANYDKRTRSAQFIHAVTGDSLLTMNGEAWQRERRLIQPTFHRARIQGFAEQMVGATQSLLEQWRAAAARRVTLDVASEMMRLTATIVGRTLFSTEVAGDAPAIERALGVIMPVTFAKLGRIVQWPTWVPTTENRQFRSALRDIDRVVYSIIEQHRRDQADGKSAVDLLSMLLEVRDPDTGQGLSNQQLRNETLTFLLAGHETTANALTWTFYLLSLHPEIEAQLRAEVVNVLGNRAPTLEDLPRLGFTRNVIKESMRLYPPIWIVERRVVADDVVGGFRLPAGSAVVVSPYALHRHAGFWSAPERFDPSRFTQADPEGRMARAYIPFGVGARFCIGHEFAMLEAQLIVSMVAQSYRLRLVPGHPVVPLPGITLRLQGPLSMTLDPY